MSHKTTRQSALSVAADTFSGALEEAERTDNATDPVDGDSDDEQSDSINRAIRENYDHQRGNSSVSVDHRHVSFGLQGEILQVRAASMEEFFTKEEQQLFDSIHREQIEVEQALLVAQGRAGIDAQAKDWELQNWHEYNASVRAIERDLELAEKAATAEAKQKAEELERNAVTAELRVEDEVSRLLLHHSHNTQHRSIAMQNALSDARVAFETHMKHREQRQELWMRHKVAAGQRRIRNMKAMMTLMEKQLSGRERDRCKAETQFYIPHRRNVITTEVEQAQEIHKLETVFLTRVFEHQLNVLAKRMRNMLKHMGAIEATELRQWQEMAHVTSNGEKQLAELENVRRRDRRVQEARRRAAESRKELERSSRSRTRETHWEYEQQQAELEKAAAAAMRTVDESNVRQGHAAITRSITEMSRLEVASINSMSSFMSNPDEASHNNPRDAQTAEMRRQLDERISNLAQKHAQILENMRKEMRTSDEDEKAAVAKPQKELVAQFREQLASLKAEQAEERMRLLETAQKDWHQQLAVQEEESNARQARATTEAVLAAMMDPCIVADVNGLIISFNDAACQLFDYTREEVMGRNVSLLCEPTIGAIHDTFLSNYRRTGIPRIIGTQGREVSGQAKGGRLIPLHLSVSRATTGDDLLFVASLHDLTKVKSQQEDLERSAARMASVFNAVLNAMVVADTEGTILTFNVAAQQLFGYTEEEVKGKNISSLCPPKIAAIHDSYLERYRKTRQGKIIGTSGRDIMARHSTGNLFPARLTVTESVRDSVYIGVIRDMRGSLEAEDLQQATLRGLVNGTVVIDEDRLVQIFNPAAERLFGYSASEVIGKNVSMLCDPATARVHDSYVNNYLRTLEPRIIGTAGRQVRGRKKDGSLFPFLLTVTESMAADYRRMFVGCIHDQTALFGQQDTIRGVLAAVTDPLIMASSDGIIELINEAATKVFGYEQKEVAGQNVSILCAPGTAEKHDAYIRRYNATKVPKVLGTEGLSVVGKRKDGSLTKLWLNVNVAEVSGSYHFIATLSEEKKEKKSSNVSAANQSTSQQ